MKIFTAAQIKACDAYTIQASRMQSVDLMERAANKCVNWLKEQFPRDALFVTLCGNGNNGGDGLAITRLLHNRGHGVKAFILKIGKELTPDCYANMLRLQRIDANLVTVVEPDTYITDLPSNIVIIDAILGTGLSRPTEGWVASFINYINELPNRKIAIDMPSGMPADVIPDKEASIVKVEDTLSFQFYKRSFLHPETAGFTGNIHILDIGLDSTFINATHTLYSTIDKEVAKEIFRPRKQHTHKGDYGKVLVIGGSYGKIGAITLCARAAIHAGAGIVNALIPEVGYQIMQTAIPEVMCRTFGEKVISKIDGWELNDAVAVGPGLSTETDAAHAFEEFIDACTQPVVIDADAINLLSLQPDLLNKIPKNSILTPHPKEFSRLFGENTNSMIQADHARIQAMRLGVFIVLKNHHTIVVTPDGDCWYNMTGNPGMATAGSGDVLTGILTGLLAQGYSSLHAALLGVYLHGAAGDFAAQELSQEAMIAGDIVRHLGNAFLSLYK